MKKFTIMFDLPYSNTTVTTILNSVASYEYDANKRTLSLYDESNTLIAAFTDIRAIWDSTNEQPPIKETEWTSSED